MAESIASKLATLTETQREIYQYVHVEGNSPEAAADHFGKMIAIINAQITRIRNKGLKVNVGSKHSKASNTEKIIEQAKAQANGQEVDVDPSDTENMLLFGVTMQFMKLAGGRIKAHQMIEDVYSAVKIMNGESPDVKKRTAKP